MQTRPPREKRGVTMHEVAQYAGVSRATVSRIVNNRDAPISISEATRRNASFVKVGDDQIPVLLTDTIHL